MITNLKTCLDTGNVWDGLTKNRMNETSGYKLAIIGPVYNEVKNIYRLEEKLATFVARSLNFPVCILFVNDSSTDSSEDLIIDVYYRQVHFYFINLTKNGGLSTVIKAGIETFSHYPGYIDEDSQTTPEDFNLLIPYLSEYETVTGIRTNREDSLVKRILSKIANEFRWLMTNDRIEDTGWPLKVMQTIYAKRNSLFTGMHRFLPALIQFQNGRVKQIPVRYFPRIAGKSKYNLGNRIVAPFSDCFAYRWMKSRYINYAVVGNNNE